MLRVHEARSRRHFAEKKFDLYQTLSPDVRLVFLKNEETENQKFEALVQTWASTCPIGQLIDSRKAFLKESLQRFVTDHTSKVTTSNKTVDTVLGSTRNGKCIVEHDSEEASKLRCEEYAEEDTFNDVDMEISFDEEKVADEGYKSPSNDPCQSPPASSQTPKKPLPVLRH